MSGALLASALVWFATFVVSTGQQDEGFLVTASAILFETSFGPIWLVRLASLALLVAASFSHREGRVLLLSSVVVACEG